ncbi:MAG: PstS family phosphate ABC transporter substrate-binding protein [Phototrophicales bacterium]
MSKIMRGVCAILLLSLFVSVITAQEEEDTTITVTGSQLVANLLNTFAQSTQTELTFEIAGTSNGFDTFCAGQSDITGASRPIAVEEENLCNTNGITYAEYLIAYDVLTVVTHPDLNIECLGINELDNLFNPVSNINFWDETNLPDIGTEPITLFLPANNTAAYALLDNNVSGLGLRGETIADATERLESISNTPGAIGVLSLSNLDETANVNVVAIRNPQLGDCFTPSIETIEARQYPLANRLFIYVNQNASESINDLLNTIVNEDSANLVADAGFTPISTESYALNQAVLAGEQAPGRQFSSDVVEYEIPANISGEITIAGAPELGSYLTDITSSFSDSYPGVTPVLNILGERAGIREFCNGIAEIVVTRRDFTEDELTGCTNNNVNPVPLDFGKRAVVLVRSVSADFAQCLSAEEVINIWGTNITNAPETWDAINADFPEIPLTLVAPSVGSSSADILLTPAAGAVIPIRLDVAETNNDPLYRAVAVSNTEGGLTFMEWTEYLQVLETLPEENEIELVEVDNGNGCVLPSEETIADGSYPYTRNIQLIASQFALTRSEVQGLLWFMYEDSNYVKLLDHNILGIPFADLGEARQALQDIFNDALASGIEPLITASEIAPEAPVDIFTSPEATPETTPEVTPEATPETAGE